MIKVVHSSCPSKSL